MYRIIGVLMLIMPIVALMLVLLLPFSHAAVFFMPKEIPSNVNWSFFVAQNPTDSFDSADLYFDGEKIIAVYSNGQAIIDPFNGKFVLKAFTFDEEPGKATGLHLYVSHFGLNEGTHTVKLETKKGDEIVDITEGEIAVFDALQENYGIELDKQLDVLSNLSISLGENLQNLGLSIESARKNADEMNSALEQKINESMENLANFQSVLNDLNSNIDDMGKGVAEGNKKFMTLNTEVQMLKEELGKQKAGLDAVRAEASPVSYLGLANSFLIALAVVGLVLVFVRRREIAEMLKRR